SLYGPLFRIAAEPEIPQPTLSALAGELPPGTRYVLCVLKPSRESVIDAADIQSAIVTLSGGTLRTMPDADYVAIAGTAGSTPSVLRGSNRPFSSSGSVGGVQVDVRMQSWLATDTIRRTGFGQGVAA